MKRTSKSKPLGKKVNKRILILCEGETECEYFEAFKSDEQLKSALAGVDIDTYQPKDFSPRGLVKEAKRKKKEAERKQNPFNSIWIVFDRDQHQGVPEAFQEAIDAGINKAFSSVCFEFWIVLHFEFTTRVFKDSDELLSYIKSKHYADYKKGQECFSHLRDKVEIAITRAERICKNAMEEINAGQMKLHNYSPYTDIYKLVSELLELAKK